MSEFGEPHDSVPRATFDAQVEKSAKRLRALERIVEYLIDRDTHSDACDCDLCNHIRIGTEAIDLE